MIQRFRSAPLLLGAFLAAACGTSDDHGHEKEGAPTASVCPSTSVPNYDNFGRSFMQTYCTKCHSRSLTGDGRHGAPLAHDFDTLQGVVAVAEHIDEFAAAGPNAINTEMPPEDVTPTPTLEERQRLGEWLACEIAADR